MNYTAYEAEAGVVQRYYIGAEDMMQDGLSRSAAHRLINSSPSRILVKVEGKKAYLAIPRASYHMLLSQRRQRGNPRMQDPDFQKEMAMRRWRKART